MNDTSSTHPLAAHGGVLWDTVRDLLESAQRELRVDSLRVLDLGGGTGGLAVPVAELDHRVSVVDPSPDALAALDRRAREHGVEDRIVGVQGDAADLLEHVDAGQIDVVLCHEVLGVVDHPGAALDAIRAAIRPGGLLSVVVAGRFAAVLARALAGHLAQARAMLDARLTSWDVREDGPRRYSPDEIVDLIRRHGFVARGVQAVRVFADLVPGAVLDVEPGAPHALLDLERAVAEVPELAAVAAQLHVQSQAP